MASSSPKSEDRGKPGGIIHVFSSSYLGRLFKNPFSLANIAPFKMRPMRNRAERYSLPERPPVGRACANCFESTVLDQGTESIHHGQQYKSRLCDVLEIPSTASENSYQFVKRMADVVHTYKMDMRRDYPRVDDAVLASERVHDGIMKNVTRVTDADDDTLRLVDAIDVEGSKPTRQQEQGAGRVPILLTRERARAKSALHRMRAHISGWTLKIANYILFKLLRFILRTVQITPGQVEKLKKASQEKIPIIYLPNHRSHLDYILLSFTLAQFGFRTPYVAAGENLDIPLFSWLLRSLGAFFIKRRLDKDWVYRAVLHSYIEELLKKGESLEFFMEAGRSRTGRPILPKAGLLSVVIETYLQGLMPNAYIVPVSISYEKLIEGNFNCEMMGEPKKEETFVSAVKAIWNVFNRKYGSVRVDFGQPVTVKDYLDCLRQHLPPLPNSDAAAALSNMFEFCQIQQQQRLTKSFSSRNSLLSLCSGIDSNVITDEHRRLIRAMCNHIVYDFSQNTALMCTQMLAFLLTTKYRRGGRLDDVVDDFFWLCRRVMANGRDVGFSGDPRDVVRYALELLGSDLVASEISDIDSGVGSDSGFFNGIRPNDKETSLSSSVNNESHLWLIKPTVVLPHVHELAYYAAPVGLVFLREAVVAAALLSISLETNKASISNLLNQEQDLLDSSPVSKISTTSTTTTKANAGTIHSSKIIDRALALTDLLQHEFLFAKPCTSTRQCLEQTLERMVQDGLLLRRGRSSSVSSTAASSGVFNVRFCLEKNRTYETISSPTTSSRGSTSSLQQMDDDTFSSTTSISDKQQQQVPQPQSRGGGRRKQSGNVEDIFYLPSEDDELADYEDEVDQDDDDDLFARRYSSTSSSLSQRRSSYGIASLVENDDDYNADVIRLYASSLAPILESYKFAFKTALAELSQTAGDASLMRTQWKTEGELVRKLLTLAKEAVRDGAPYNYAEFVNSDSMRNAIRWLVLKGVLVSSHDRLRLHDSYVDDRETLERFRTEIDELCVVVTY